jgi:hypothetical protein
MKYLQIHLDQPCSEGWDSMKPDEKGRFCASCAKTVVDFTNMSNVDLLDFFKKNKGKDVCGRILPYQLECPLPMISPAPVRYAHAFALAAGIALTNPVYAKPLQSPIFEIVSSQNVADSSQIQERNSVDTSFKITFNVYPIDEKCLIEISAFGTKKQVTNGQIDFDLPKRKLKKAKIKVKITFFEPLIREVNQEIDLKLSDKKVFALKIEEVPMLGRICTETVNKEGKKLVRTKYFSELLRGFRVIAYPL